MRIILTTILISICSLVHANTLILRAQPIGAGQKQIDVFKQYSSLVAGNNYDFSFDVINVNKPITVSNGSSLIVVNTSGNYTLSFTASSTNEAINFFHQSNGFPARIELDNVKLTEKENVLYVICLVIEDEDYRYAFNGKEKDDEIKSGIGNSYNYGARMYDSRLGRFLSIDPMYAGVPHSSPYSYAVNSPILFIDFDGEVPKLAIIMVKAWKPYEFDAHVKALRDQGYTVVKVNTGAEMLDALSQNSSPDDPVNDLILVSHSTSFGMYGGVVETDDDEIETYVGNVGFYTEKGMNYFADEHVTKQLNTRDEFKNPDGTVNEDAINTYKATPEYEQEVEEYKAVMRENGARITDDFGDMLDEGTISLELTMPVIVGGCWSVGCFGSGGKYQAYESVALNIAKETESDVVASKGKTGPGDSSGGKGTTKRLGVWIKINPKGEGRTVGTGEIDLTTRKMAD